MAARLSRDLTQVRSDGLSIEVLRISASFRASVGRTVYSSPTIRTRTESSSSHRSLRLSLLTEECTSFEHLLARAPAAARRSWSMAFSLLEICEPQLNRRREGRGRRLNDGLVEC